MPKLQSLISVGGDGPGFLLPVFKVHEGSNFEFIQKIDIHNNVSDFEPFWIDQRAITKSDSEHEVEIGGAALWAFKDHNGKITLGNALEIKSLGLNLLQNKILKSYPMAAAEMASFCGVEAQFPQVLLASYKALKAISHESADTWRDAVILLPAIKKGIANEVLRSGDMKSQIEDVIAITTKNVTQIYAHSSIASKTVSLPEWKTLASVFGIERFELHETNSNKTPIAKVRPTWSIYGAGGIARFVITKPPFLGTEDRSESIPDSAVAHGIETTKTKETSDRSRLLIGILGSDSNAAHDLEKKSKALYSEYQFKHAFNVRPIGSGTPSPRKTPPKLIYDILDSYDCLWIVANHRLRQTGRFYTGLSLSNTASRYIQIAASGLIACLHTKMGNKFLSEISRAGGFCLIGATRYISTNNEEQIIKQTLYSMLCEDVLLRTAKRITLLWPYNTEQKLRTVRLAHRKYRVEIIPAISISKQPYVVGYATDARLSSGSYDDFRDLCISLVSAYGWDVRYEDDDSLTLENEGEAMRIWPTTSLNEMETILSKEGKFGRAGDLIVTNQTIPKNLREYAAGKKWSICHYSEVGRWMRFEYRMGIFKDI